jgi:alkylhydroperoxidase/carboxymuconolactone decarboxylase family protein YurZ
MAHSSTHSKLYHSRKVFRVVKSFHERLIGVARYFVIMAEKPPFLTTLDDRDPEFGDLVTELRSHAMAEGALSPKTKVLIVLAIDAAMNYPGGVESFADAAREHGATEQEITETIELVIGIKAIQGLASGSGAFDEP